MEKTDKKDKDDKPHTVVRNAADYQRLKLEKLMKNPDKPVLIPERPKEKGAPHVPDFVRNVMGSSAGAGSGEFHVYRHLRRKEYARQKYMQEKATKEELNLEYQRKLEENKIKAAERTAKKRAKRLKKKEKQKNQKKTKTREKKEVSLSSESSEETENEESISNEDSNKKEDLIKIKINESSDKKDIFENPITNEEQNEADIKEQKEADIKE